MAEIDPSRLHSRFAPSSLARVLSCPPSLLLSEARARVISTERPPTVWAAEGTVAHQLAAELLADLPNGLQLDDRVAVPPHEIIVDDEMFVASATFANFISGLKTEDSVIWLEQLVRLDQIVGADAGMFGHLDAAVWHRDIGLLEIADFKYGRGVIVHVEDNPQLYAYALGAIHTLIPAAERALCTQVRLHIMQPRLGDAGLHSLTLERAELDLWGEDLLRPVVRALVDGTLDDAAPLTPGDWCRFCPVMSECPALFAQAQALARQVFSNGSDVASLPPLDNDTLGAILDQAEIILPWIESVRTLAQSRLEMGGRIPGWKLVAKRGHRVWNQDDTETVRIIGHWGLLLENIWQPVKPKSPAQLEKFIPNQHRDEFRTLWRMESSGVTLAPRGDARMEKLPDARKMFDNNQA